MKIEKLERRKKINNAQKNREIKDFKLKRKKSLISHLFNPQRFQLINARDKKNKQKIRVN